MVLPERTLPLDFNSSSHMSMFSLTSAIVIGCSSELGSHSSSSFKSPRVTGLSLTVFLVTIGGRELEVALTLGAE